jgi:hypothetical protein
LFDPPQHKNSLSPKFPCVCHGPGVQNSETENLSESQHDQRRSLSSVEIQILDGMKHGGTGEEGDKQHWIARTSNEGVRSGKPSDRGSSVSTMLEISNALFGIAVGDPYSFPNRILWIALETREKGQFMISFMIRSFFNICNKSK